MGQQGKQYTDKQRQAIVDRICDELMDGKSLRRICEADDMPNKTTILRWLNDENDTLAPSIAMARAYQADALDDDIQDMVNRMLDGEIGHQEARVAIWAIQWRAAKLKPKKYGDYQRIDQKISKDYDGMDDTELDREIAALEQKLEESRVQH